MRIGDTEFLFTERDRDWCKLFDSQPVNGEYQWRFLKMSSVGYIHLAQACTPLACLPFACCHVDIDDLICRYRIDRDLDVRDLDVLINRLNRWQAEPRVAHAWQYA